MFLIMGAVALCCLCNESEAKTNAQLNMLIKIGAAELGAIGTVIIAAIMKLILE